TDPLRQYVFGISESIELMIKDIAERRENQHIVEQDHFSTSQANDMNFDPNVTLPQADGFVVKEEEETIRPVGDVTERSEGGIARAEMVAAVVEKDEPLEEFNEEPGTSEQSYLKRRRISHKSDLIYKKEENGGGFTAGFRCKTCGKVFGYSSHLTSHILTHTGTDVWRFVIKKLHLNQQKSLLFQAHVHTSALIATIVSLHRRI
ncbi:hypothetical protein PENTCL1PPCAC_25927, partial [Pristionchus entomophagus]